MRLDRAKLRKLCAEKFGSKPGERPSYGQSELAKVTELSPVTISRLMNGRQQPTALTLAALAGALGETPAGLLIEDFAELRRARAKALGVKL